MLINLEKPIVCLMGPTASGKTPLAIELVKQFPFEIISVDSAMIYRDMNIGTAKPTSDILKQAPHRLIDILDPIEIYSAGAFCFDAVREIKAIFSEGKIPLLVGGTMMYFRALQQGLASLPPANSAIREVLTKRGKEEGWEVLHQELKTIDPLAFARIKSTDSQRIQRALEVFQLTGQTITALQQETHASPFQFLNIGLIPKDRSQLHYRIATRFSEMLRSGFIDEVKSLYERGDLSCDLPSIRSVGYRQIWSYLAGHLSFDNMQEKALTSTRQLAKRQLTWLRTWPHLQTFNSEDPAIFQTVKGFLAKKLII